MARIAKALGAITKRTKQELIIIKINLRIAGFDGLRAIAVILVFLEHRVIEGYLFGSFGVKLFFVLSGYLIVSILHKQRANIDEGAAISSEIFEFWRRRALRIFPIYFLTLAIISISISVGYIESQGIAYYWFFAGNFYLKEAALLTGKIPFGDFGHLWSVAVENQFYLLAGVILLLWRQRVHVRILFTILIISAGAVLYDTSVGEKGNFNSVMPLQNFAFMAAGGMIPLWWEKEKYRNILIPALIACAALLLINRLNIELGVSAKYLPLLRYFLEMVAAFGIVAHVSRFQNGIFTRALEWNLLRSLGVISYGFYVYHFFTPRLITITELLDMSAPSTNRNYVWMVVQFSIAVIVSDLSWRLIEKPLLRLKSPD